MVLVGDTSVGKSCLIRNYLENSFAEDYEPTVLDIYKGIKNVKRRQIEVEIHDTSGDFQLGVNRATQYRGTDVFLICVAVNNRDSLGNVDVWKREIQAVEPRSPIVLVMTKGDLGEFIENPITK